MDALAAPVYAFDGFRLDARTRQLAGPGGVPLALTGKALEVLLYLVEHADRVVDKDELLAQVWAGRVVEENTLTQAVSALRKALGTGAGDHRFILTVPGRGYRFVAVLDAPEAVAAPAPLATPSAARAAPASSGWRRLALLGALVIALSLFLAAAPRLPERTGEGTATKSGDAALAVLPFRPLGDERDPLLELGMAETLIAQLGGLDALPVRSLDAVQRFVDGHDPVDAGRRLQVAYVVAGSIQHHGERVRVNVRLLAVPDGRTLWAGTFDEQRDRVFTLQDAIADAVGGALAVKASAAARRRSPCDGDDAEAYRAYLVGRYVMDRISPARFPEAFAALQRAIELDPTCARAYAALARLHVAQALVADAEPRRVFPHARAAAAQALTLDPDSAEAWIAKGRIEAWHDWNWPLAEASFRRAIALDPDSADAHLAHAPALDDDEAMAHLWRAQELDPLSPAINLTLATWLADIDPAAAQARLARALELEPEYWEALWLRGEWAMAEGRPREGIADLQRAVERSDGNGWAVARLAMFYVDAGEHARAQALLQELEARDRRGYVPGTALARIHVALGNTDRALDALERAYEQRDPRMAFFSESASLASLRSHPRFRALVQRVEEETGPVRGGE